MIGHAGLIVFVIAAPDAPSIRATWDLPPRCDPFAPVRIKDLKEELRQTGYRLVIAIHPEPSPSSKEPAGEPPPRDLFFINADGTALEPLTQTADRDERTPRTSPTGKEFTYNYGDYLVDVRTRKTRQVNGGYVWAPDGKSTIACEKRGIYWKDVETGERRKPIRVERDLGIVDLSVDGKWFIFEIRNYLGCQYTIDFISSEGGEIRKMPNHPVKAGECHPAFSPDGRWMCWNAGNSLGIRRFAPEKPDGTEGEITTLPEEKMGQDPCGRWSHCGRYIAYVRIPHRGSWKVHSPLWIVRVADGAAIQLSPPGWLGHHWDYDWLPPADR